VVELVDTADLKSAGSFTGLCGFDSRRVHMKKKSKPKYVYLVVKTSSDINSKFFDVRGIFSSFKDAKAFRQELWDLRSEQSEILTYILR
jgi:hypothetical protein